MGAIVQIVPRAGDGVQRIPFAHPPETQPAVRISETASDAVLGVPHVQPAAYSLLFLVVHPYHMQKLSRLARAAAVVARARNCWRGVSGVGDSTVPAVSLHRNQKFVQTSQAI